MENKKPQVFPTREELEIANAVGTQLATNEEQVVVDDPIGNSSQVSNGESAASAEMIRRTQEQIELRAHADRHGHRILLSNAISFRYRDDVSVGDALYAGGRQSGWISVCRLRTGR